jgi:16S rRNA (uracil1498-N3)-methyltransferase
VAENAWRGQHRFYVETPLAVGATVAVDGLARQLAGVLRLAPGARIILFDGGGSEHLAEIQTLTTRQATAAIIAARPCPADPRFFLTLFQCSLKQDKFEWVLQKGTELGVARFAPVISGRSVVRPADALRSKYPRWRAVLREATEQCGRARIPELAEPLTWDAAMAMGDGQRLVAWEAAQESRPLATAVAALAESARAAGVAVRLSVAIGPEGGLADDEIVAARAHGWETVSLGPRILRAETAAVSAAAVVAALLDGLR